LATTATGAHIFYEGSPVGEKLRIDGGGSISCTGNINMGTNNSYPDIRLGSANGNNLGIATTAGAFSSSSAVNDMVVRSLNRLILQSGGSAYAILVDTNNYVNINNRLIVNGIANFHNDSPLGIAYMQSSSLIIGGTNANYGGSFYANGNCSGTNTAGLLMECADNTEIVVHDYNNRLSSLIYYVGGGNNKITISRDMGWGAIHSVVMNGNVVSTGYIFAGVTTSGLRINGNDYGNTIYQDAATINGQPANIGFTLRNANTFNFYSLSTVSSVGYTNIMNMNTNGIALNKDTTITGKLNFPNTLDQYKINLWGTNNYGSGIAASTLQYSSQGNHSFYNSANNANTFTITSMGNVSCTGSIGCVGVSASGGMLIGTYLGIQNTTPLSMLHLGNCTVLNSAPVIVFW
jgi:hypothetical protein